MRALELLAPAKNLACGMAAIDHGADAVYIGAPHYGARAAAGNSIEDIQSLCNYAHQFGAKVYVTLNTIIYDEELEQLRQLVHLLKDIGVDAILVQDMSLLELCPPTLPLHASTQTDNRTAEKVRWLHDIGFSRAVLARELSVEEIAAIHHSVPEMELEVFVHGALCVSYSGICYASQYCFQRSANRGECAQFCRMKFSLFDANRKEIEHERHLLSLKDMNQSENLLELIEAGASSFKIEGRLKDVAYVKNVTAAYSEKLNEIIRNCGMRKAPALCFSSDKGYVKFLQGLPKNSFERILTDNEAVYDELKDKYPCEFYNDEYPLSKLYSLETKIQEILGRNIWLKSGGNILIEHTEAMTVIDVNSAKNISSKEREANILQINKEAAYQIARQLRLRNISGIIIVDFINMQKEDSKQELIDYIKSQLVLDPVRCDYVDMTSLGLVEIVRRKIKPPIYEILSK